MVVATSTVLVALTGTAAVAVLAYKSQVAWATVVALVAIATVWYVHSRQPLAPIDLDGGHSVDHTRVRGGVLYPGLNPRRTSSRFPINREKSRLIRKARAGADPSTLARQAGTILDARRNSGLRGDVHPRIITDRAVMQQLQDAKYDNRDLKRMARRMQFDSAPRKNKFVVEDDRKQLMQNFDQTCNSQLSPHYMTQLLQNENMDVWFIRRGRADGRADGRAGGHIIGFIMVNPEWNNGNYDELLVAEVEIACAKTGGMRQLMENVVSYYFSKEYHSVRLESVSNAIVRYQDFGFRSLKIDGSLLVMHYPRNEQVWDIIKQKEAGD